MSTTIQITRKKLLNTALTWGGAGMVMALFESGCGPSGNSSGPLGGGGQLDLGPPDSGNPDSGYPDAGSPDSGTPDGGVPDGGLAYCLNGARADAGHNHDVEVMCAP